MPRCAWWKKRILSPRQCALSASCFIKMRDAANRMMSLIVIFGSSMLSGADLIRSRNARMRVASKEVLWVNCAISLRLSCMVFAITRRRFGILISSYSILAGAAGAFTAGVSITPIDAASEAVCLPPRPNPALFCGSVITSRSITPCGLWAAREGSTPR